MERTAVKLENTRLTVSFEYDEGTKYYAGDRYLLSVEKEYEVNSINNVSGAIYFHVDAVLEKILMWLLRCMEPDLQKETLEAVNFSVSMEEKSFR